MEYCIVRIHSAIPALYGVARVKLAVNHCDECLFIVQMIVTSIPQ